MCSQMTSQITTAFWMRKIQGQWLQLGRCWFCVNGDDYQTCSERDRAHTTRQSKADGEKGARTECRNCKTRSSRELPRLPASMSDLLRRYLLKEFVKLGVDHAVNLSGERLGLVRQRRNAVDDIAGDNLEVVLNSRLEVRDSHSQILEVLEVIGRGLTLDLVRTGLNYGGVVVAATSVPGEQVGGVGGHVAQGSNSGDAEHVGLHLLGGDGSDGVLRLARGLEREVVSQKAADVR